MELMSIVARALDEMKSHGERDYPSEACGLLLGTVVDGLISIDESVAVRNLNRQRARDRYELDPRGHLDADRRARATGRDIVGIYHSHPDHPARPSEFDRDHGYPGWAYLIVSVGNGTAGEVGAFVLEEEGGGFQTVELLVA